VYVTIAVLFNAASTPLLLSRSDKTPYSTTAPFFIAPCASSSAESLTFAIIDRHDSSGGSKHLQFGSRCNSCQYAWRVHNNPEVTHLAVVRVNGLEIRGAGGLPRHSDSRIDHFGARRQGTSGNGRTRHHNAALHS